MSEEKLRESLKRSHENKQAMLKRFGFVPLSVLHLTRGALSRSMYSLQHERPERNIAKSPKAREKAEALRAAGHAGNSTASGAKAGRGTLGASIMPAELVDFFVRYYAKPGDTYLDLFMGQGIRMQVAKQRGLHYVGMDCSRDFFAYVSAIKDKIDDGTTLLRPILGDSRDPHEVPDGVGDFSFHSPPYWDIEFYGNEPEQLGISTAHSYDAFLVEMEKIAHAWLPKFKSGAWHVVNVNDFRKDGRFFAYHADLIAAFCRAGWLLHDTWIVDGLVGGMPRAFAVDFNMKRIAPKTHEYALVFRAP